MRLGVWAAATVLVCSGALAPILSAQNQPAAQSLPSQPAPAPDQTSPTDQSAPNPAAGLPPTPLEQRDQQVRQVDPLDRELEKKKKEKEEREAGKKRDDDNAPLPGSIAASEKRAAESAGPAAGPQVEENNDQEGPVQEYTGPAVLSRSYSLTQALIPEQVKWNESVGVSSSYYAGVSRTVSSNGTLGPATSLLGTNMRWSFGGQHYFHRDSIVISYTGNYNLFNGGSTANAYTGINQNVALAYSHVMSKRLSFNLMSSGAFLSMNAGLQNPNPGAEGIANINISSSPNIQIFDTGSKQISTQFSLVYQQTARLSYSAGVSWFGIAQDSPLLLGMTGRQAHGDVNYRLTRNMTVGTFYSFSQYVYPHGVGNSATTSAGAIYSYAFNRTTQLRFRGGVSITQTLGLVSVPLNPLIAELLGVASGVIDSYQTYIGEDFSAQFVKDFRSGTTGSISYVKGISPGNGVYQTSEQQSIAGAVSMKLFRRYGVSFSAGRDSLSAVGLAVVQNLGSYASEYATVATGKTFGHGVGLNFNATYRHYELNSVGFNRNQLNFSSGLSWGSSGRLWPF